MVRYHNINNKFCHLFEQLVQQAAIMRKHEKSFSQSVHLFYFLSDNSAFSKFMDLTISLLFKVYDAINENPEAPNIDFPDDADESKAIIDFHACKCWGIEKVPFTR